MPNEQRSFLEQIRAEMDGDFDGDGFDGPARTAEAAANHKQVAELLERIAARPDQPAMDPKLLADLLMLGITEQRTTQRLLEKLIAVMSAPKRLVRGNDGKAIGAEIDMGRK